MTRSQADPGSPRVSRHRRRHGRTEESSARQAGAERRGGRHQHGPGRRHARRLRDDRRHVDVGRRVAGRHDAGVRPAGRPLHRARSRAERRRRSRAGRPTTITRATRPTARPSRSRPTRTGWRTSGSSTPTARTAARSPAEKTAYVRSAAWLPGGDYLVARREDGKRAGIPPCELWLFHRRGGSGIKLTSGDDLNNAAGPVASRDGRFIYFAARRDALQLRPEDWPAASGRSSASIGRPASARRSPAASAARRGRRCRPTARRWCTSAGATPTRCSWRARWRPGAERLLARGLSRDDQEGFAAMDVWPNYAFTPDGSALIFSSGGHLQRLSLAAGATPAVIPFTARSTSRWRRR